MNKTRIQIAKPDIVSFFNDYPSHVLKPKEIAAILSEQRGFWRLAQRTTTADFIYFLKESSKLKLFEFKFPHRSKSCYAWGEIPLLAVLMNISKDIHFSHYTAMQMHGLTEQVPKSIYLTEERATETVSSHSSLTQAQIEAAFSGPPRISNNWVEFADNRIYLLSGSHTNHLGVVTQEVSDGSANQMVARLTGLERTLIDIAVRPFYAGGIFEVAKAYEAAKGDVSINKLAAMLRKLDFTYPFHQAIGYYLERAGYKSSLLDLLRSFPIEQDFYLTYGMGKTSYIKNWRLFVPQGF
jgi:predicted transcriptional regulator of viral defense system